MASSSLLPRSVVAIFGPTASGKTALAGELRARLGATVISADSAALYRGLPVLTAAPDYPTELVGVLDLGDEASVGWYQREAQAAIDRSERPLVVGGTGLYFRAALAKLELPPPPAEGVRERWELTYDELGAESAHALLAERDPEAALRVHANDRRRVVRALELAEAGHSLAGDRLWTEHPRVPTTVVCLDLPLDELDRRIDARMHAMVAAGVADEARAAWEKPLSETARRVLGLEEFATLPEAQAVEAVSAATKRLARYQKKWMRSLAASVTLDGRRAVGELADEVVALERSGEHLSRH
ncbi:MAG TPA: tRNA (adenosine(37)-N6)-dimethylallyltransferase MiaA [Gaiellaceae bacterium]|nr:tRNA (adenosine(37)-N6)-dimethylallyltransferase MiaA [Gaiellaceae bacterium]